MASMAVISSGKSSDHIRSLLCPLLDARFTVRCELSVSRFFVVVSYFTQFIF